jgi:predicted O-methyltransferase YrrM
MDATVFCRAFWHRFGSSRNEIRLAYFDPEYSAKEDLCPEVEGKLSIKKQQLLNLAYGLLPEGEAYLEIGTYHGKSLLSALIGNAPRPTYACDNFSEFDVNSLQITLGNLDRYDLRDAVTFYDSDFRAVCTSQHLPSPIGLYFYDGAHDFESQYLAIKLVEPFLANEAIILVDDWRFAPDSQSYASQGTVQAASESPNTWQILYELPSRFNGDLAMWWNGVGVLSFRRTLPAKAQMPISSAE